jgi:hypothetical protein
MVVHGEGNRIVVCCAIRAATEAALRLRGGRGGRTRSRGKADGRSLWLRNYSARPGPRPLGPPAAVPRRSGVVRRCGPASTSVCCRSPHAAHPWTSPCGSLRFTRNASLSLLRYNPASACASHFLLRRRACQDIRALAFAACGSPIYRRSAQCDSPSGGSANAYELLVWTVQ